MNALITGDDGVVGELVDRSDVVFHLAAAVGVELIVSHPVRTIRNGVVSIETAGGS